MSDFEQVLFTNHRATPLFLARWRAKGALAALSPDLTLTEDDATATELFKQLWTVAFPTRSNLPDEPLHDADGKITIAFHRVWH